MLKNESFRQGFARAEVARTYVWSTILGVLALSNARGLDLRERLIIVLPYALTIGTAVFVHRLLFRRRIARLPFMLATLANAVSIGVLLGVGFVATILLVNLVEGTSLVKAIGNTYRSLVYHDAAIGLVMAWLAANVVVFMNEMGRRLGPGTFWRWITGRYHRPRREERTFLFIDMAGSTRAAERLGDERFASLLQECFLDATEAIVSTRAEVVNYVGDEIILAWRSKRRRREDPAYEAFTAFLDTLHRREAEYRMRYGFAPRFRAAAHRGTAIVTEVGGVRCQLTYLGDAMNTCARLLSFAGEEGYEFVASEEAAQAMADVMPIGYVELRGKAEPVAVYAPSTSTEDRAVPN